MSIVVPILTEFKSDGINKAIDQFKSLEGAGKKAQYAIKKAAIPAAAALAGLGVALGDAVKGAIEDQSAAAQLAHTLKISTNATDAQVKSMEDFISKMGIAFGVADDKLRPVIGQLARATGDLGRAQELTTLAQNISAATGKDLATVGNALTKASLGQFTALKKLGVPLGENTMALIDMAKFSKAAQKAQVDLDSALAGGDKKEISRATEKLAEAQQKLNLVTVEGADFAADLNKAFAGSAETAAQTAAGGFARFNVAMNEAKESVGYALLPVLEKVMPVLASLGSWAQTHTQTFLIVAGVIGGIAAAIVTVNMAMSAWAAAQTIATAAQWAFNAAVAANPIVLISAGIAALIAGLVLAYKHFEGVRNVINAVGGALENGFFIWLDAIKTEANIVWNVFRTVFNGIARAWNNTVGKLSFHVPDWVPGIGGAGFDVPNIPMLANGGIVNSPTLALIGESGPEAVVPLSRGAGMAGNTVTINVNGGDPEAIVNALRRYMNRYGNVPIRTVAP